MLSSETLEMRKLMLNLTVVKFKEDPEETLKIRELFVYGETH